MKLFWDVRLTIYRDWILLRRRFKKVGFFTHWLKESVRHARNETFFSGRGISEIFIS
jgi:hypothetical protein